MRRPALTLSALACAGLLLSGCNAGPSQNQELTADELNPRDPPAIDAGSDAVPIDCADTSQVSPGVYHAGDAGTVEIGTGDDGFEVVSVQPSDGWEYDVAEPDGLVLEVRFRPVGGAADDDDTRDDDDGADASDAQEYLNDNDDDEVVILVIAQGSSADDADPSAEICTGLG